MRRDCRSNSSLRSAISLLSTLTTAFTVRQVTPTLRANGRTRPAHKIKLDKSSRGWYPHGGLRHPTFQRIFGRDEEMGAGPTLGPPLYAISKSNWNSESAEGRPLFRGAS